MWCATGVVVSSFRLIGVAKRRISESPRWSECRNGHGQQIAFFLPPFELVEQLLSPFRTGHMRVLSRCQTRDSLAEIIAIVLDSIVLSRILTIILPKLV